MTRTRRIWLGVLLVGAMAGCAPTTPTEGDRYLVYFDEFSANLTPAAHQVIAGAAKQAKETKATWIRIEGRGSATGSPAANHYLSATRVQVVADELQKDGLDPATFRQAYLGQTGSGDTSVADRRVDIILQH